MKYNDNGAFFTVTATRGDVETFNASWPCSELRDRSYWFQFDGSGDLVDTNVPSAHDGSAASALSQDCWAFGKSMGIDKVLI
jgi:hypothetical protein